MDYKKEIFEKLKNVSESHELFYISSSRGSKEIGNIIQKTAIDYKWKGLSGNSKVTKYISESPEDFENATEEAEEYLNKNLAPDGYYFGYNEDSGDFGLWRLDGIYHPNDIVITIKDSMAYIEQNPTNHRKKRQQHSHQPRDN